MPQLEKKLLSVWETEGGALAPEEFRHDGHRSPRRRRERRDVRWEPSHAVPDPRSPAAAGEAAFTSVGIAPPLGDLFLDFDPILPAWPSAERAARRLPGGRILRSRRSRRTEERADAPKPERFAVAITQGGERGRFVEMPWLEDEYRIDASDWVVLSDEGWRAVAAGDASIWYALERKLLIGFYVSRPELIAVVGNPSSRHGTDACEVEGRREVSRIVRHIRSLQLPTTVLGFWTSGCGRFAGLVEPAEPAELEELVLR